MIAITMRVEHLSDYQPPSVYTIVGVVCVSNLLQPESVYIDLPETLTKLKPNVHVVIKPMPDYKTILVVPVYHRSANHLTFNAFLLDGLTRQVSTEEIIEFIGRWP